LFAPQARALKTLILASNAGLSLVEVSVSTLNLLDLSDTRLRGTALFAKTKDASPKLWVSFLESFVCRRCSTITEFQFLIPVGTIDVSECDLTGSLVVSSTVSRKVGLFISDTSRLQELKAADNKFTEFEIKSDTLLFLDLSFNHLGGPQNMLDCPNIRTLRLSHNHLTALDLTASSNISYLQANNNNLRYIAACALPLEFLDISMNNLCGAVNSHSEESQLRLKTIVLASNACQGGRDGTVLTGFAGTVHCTECQNKTTDACVFRPVTPPGECRCTSRAAKIDYENDNERPLGSDSVTSIPLGAQVSARQVNGGSALEVNISNLGINRNADAFPIPYVTLEELDNYTSLTAVDKYYQARDNPMFDNSFCNGMPYASRSSYPDVDHILIERDCTSTIRMYVPLWNNRTGPLCSVTINSNLLQIVTCVGYILMMRTALTIKQGSTYIPAADEILSFALAFNATFILPPSPLPDPTTQIQGAVVKCSYATNLDAAVRIWCTNYGDVDILFSRIVVESQSPKVWIKGCLPWGRNPQKRPRFVCDGLVPQSEVSKYGADVRVFFQRDDENETPLGNATLKFASTLRPPIKTEAVLEDKDSKYDQRVNEFVRDIIIPTGRTLIPSDPVIFVLVDTVEVQSLVMTNAQGQSIDVLQNAEDHEYSSVRDVNEDTLTVTFFPVRQHLASFFQYSPVTLLAKIRPVVSRHRASTVRPGVYEIKMKLLDDTFSDSLDGTQVRKNGAGENFYLPGIVGLLALACLIF
jgi:hypothetical protein